MSIAISLQSFPSCAFSKSVPHAKMLKFLVLHCSHSNAKAKAEAKAEAEAEAKAEAEAEAGARACD